MKRWRFSQRRNHLLFIVLVGLIAFLLLPDIAENRRLVRAIFTVAFVVCLYSVSTSRRLFMAAGLLLVPGLASFWAEEIVQQRALVEFSLIAQAVFLIYAAWLTLKGVLSSRPELTFDTILAAVNGYLLIGVIWMIFYLIVLLYEPQAFLIAHFSPESGNTVEVLAQQISPLTYYSFVTLTTLGYGDVIAAIPTTRLLAIFEALFGQLYLVILVAGLVGRQIEDRRRGSQCNQ